MIWPLPAPPASPFTTPLDIHPLDLGNHLPVLRHGTPPHSIPVPLFALAPLSGMPTETGHLVKAQSLLQLKPPRQQDVMGPSLDAGVRLMDHKSGPTLYQLCEPG